jgi:Zn finger protein HypA/HybF involved in hydrogenase expression
MSIIHGGKAKIYINGQLIGEFSEVAVLPMGKHQPIYEIDHDVIMHKTPHHHCRNCDASWTLSTDDDICIHCGSDDIKHGEM